MRWRIEKGHVYWWLRAPRELWYTVPDEWESSKKNLVALFFPTFQEAMEELQHQLRISKVRRNAS